MLVPTNKKLSIFLRFKQLHCSDGEYATLNCANDQSVESCVFQHSDHCPSNFAFYHCGSMVSGLEIQRGTGQIQNQNLQVKKIVLTWQKTCAVVNQFYMQLGMIRENDRPVVVLSFLEHRAKALPRSRVTLCSTARPLEPQMWLAVVHVVIGAVKIDVH